MSKHRTVKLQKIKYENGLVMKSGETYIAKNGATVILKEFLIDYDGALVVSYSAMHQQMDNGEWAAGDTTPNSMYYWLWGDV